MPQQFESGVSQTESLQRLSSLGLAGATAPSGTGAPSGTTASVNSTKLANPAVPVSLTPPYDIVFEHVSFAYPDNVTVSSGTATADSITVDTATAATDVVAKTVLEDITLTIPYGQKIAVLGKSGSGKTTLARLLHGDITPSKGYVTLASVPIAKIRDFIWDYFGLISQDSYIFAMSIIDNLRIGKIEATESEIWDVLEAVDLKSYVETLPDGLNTMADEAGLRFSGGQRQRLVLARVLLQNPPIVVLDEPTVGLDPVTERVVLDTIQRVLADKTVVMITHRLQGIEDFDRVIFVEEGHLVMDGSPRALEQTNVRYQKLLMFDRGSLV